MLIRPFALFPPCFSWLLFGCGSSRAPFKNPESTASESLPPALFEPPAHARWVPEASDGGELIETLPDGSRRVILAQKLRVEESLQGALRRADDLLPVAPQPPVALALPERLGQGFVFASITGGTQLWRTHTFLGRLDPLVHLRTSPVHIVAGPDRLLVRSIHGDKLFGVDPDTGALEPPHTLPSAPRFGDIMFANAWRGVVFADLIGVMGTLDAGFTWRPLGIASAPKSIQIADDSFQIATADTHFSVDAKGNVSSESIAASTHKTSPPLSVSAAPSSASLPNAVAVGAFGKHPLRAAIEDGWPLIDGTAVVMRAGRLGRIRLEDGKIVQMSATALRDAEDTTCSAVRLGGHIGFVCGAPGRGTSLYALTAPFRAQLIAQFSKPRVVIPSENGALVVHGSCDSKAELTANATQAYCIVNAQGPVHEVYAKDANHTEHMVALSDGRVAELIPPHENQRGRVVVFPPINPDKTPPVTILLTLDTDDELTKTVMHQGLWLQGAFERAPGELGAWVEAGGMLVGVRIHLDTGVIAPGKLRQGADTLVSGPFGFTNSDTQGAFETVDGGVTWHSLEPPAMGQGHPLPGRICSHVGCIFPFERSTWLRVGWGPPEKPNDLNDASSQQGSLLEGTLPRGIHFSCDIAHIESPKTITAHHNEVPRKHASLPAPTQPFASLTQPTQPPLEAGPWLPFYGVPAPKLPAGYGGFDFGSTSPLAPARLYTWVPKGTGGVPGAQYAARFYDRFDPTGFGIHTTAPSAAPWRTEQAIAEAIGNSSVMHSFLDPSGRATLLSVCHGSGKCDLYGLAEGRAIEPLPEAEIPYTRIMPPSASALWVEEAWWVAVNTPNEIIVWRIETTRARVIARVPRLSAGSPNDVVQLVRRTREPTVGLLVAGIGTFGKSDRDFYVVPLHPRTGEQGEVMRIGPTDLGGHAPQRCEPNDDGWLVNTSLAVQPILQMQPAIRILDTELRLRLNEHQTCVESIAIRISDIHEKIVTSGVTQHMLASGKNIPLVGSAPNGQRVIAYCAP